MEAVALGTVIVIATTSIFTLTMNLFLQAGLNRLIGALKHLQIIVHILLIQVSLVAHAQGFLL